MNQDSEFHLGVFTKRCIVTGAAGFIGSALARLLLKEGDPGSVSWLEIAKVTISSPD